DAAARCAGARDARRARMARRPPRAARVLRASRPAGGAAAGAAVDLAWLAAHSADDVVAALAPHLPAARMAKIDAVLDARLGGLTVVLENLHDPHNGAAALRSIEAFGLAEIHVVEQAERFSFSSKVTQGCEKWVDICRHADFAAAARALHDRGVAL